MVSTIASTNLKQISELNTQRRLGLTILAAKDNFEAFRMLESDCAAAVVMDDILLYSIVANSSAPADYVVSDEALSVEPYGMLFRRDDPAFKKVADDALAAIYRNGDINKIYAKWFLNPIPPNGISLNVPMSAALKRATANPTHSGDPEAYAIQMLRNDRASSRRRTLFKRYGCKRSTLGVRPKRVAPSGDQSCSPSCSGWRPSSRAGKIRLLQPTMAMM